MSLLIAFASYRRRGDAGDIYFYRHDGKDKGELLPQLPTETERRRSDYRPVLSANGRLCAFACQYREGVPGELRLWDMAEKKLLSLPDRNTSGADAQPSLSGDGRWMAFAGWRRPGGKGGHDLFLYDLKENRLAPLPNVNTEFDEQMPALSADGRWLAFTSNRPEKAGGEASRTRIHLYDRQTEALVPLPGLAAPGCRDTDPSLSADGRLIAFCSDRPGPADESGAGDVYLYDRQSAALVPLPGLNSPAHECQPCLSPGARFLVFTSERLDGDGQRDLYLYDRRVSRLLPTPGLNHLSEEFEASIIALEPGLDQL
jgi:Tol biopolymer transport system component